MIYFFKMQRWLSMKNHKYFKYTKYVLGEIFIVIVGILVAIQLNNWNEERKEREKFNQVLLEVQGELQANISDLRQGIIGFAFLDKTCQEIFIDSFANRPYLLSSILYKYPREHLIDFHSLDKLIQINNLTNDQDSIVDRLKEIRNLKYYEIYLKELTEIQELCLDQVKEYDWYPDWNMNRFGYDQAWAILKDDSDFMILALEFFQVSSNCLAELNGHEIVFLGIFQRINEYLDKQGINNLDSSIFDYDPHKYEKYVGKYKVKWCSDKTFIPYDSVVVSIENDKLMYNAYLVKRGFRTEFTPSGYGFFRTNHMSLWGFGVFHAFKNNQGEDELRFSRGPKYTLRLIKVD